MVIAVINSKGGVGKSTIAVHLAVWLHDRGHRVGLVDADAQASSGAWLARAAPAVPIYPIADSSELLRRLPELAGRHPVLVADGPAALDATTVALIGAADVVLLPVGPSPLDVAASYRAARAIYKVRFAVARAAPLAAFTVFNRVQPRTRLARVAAAAVVKYGFPIARTVLQARQAYAEACGAGTVVWRLGGPGAAAAREIDALFAEILGPRLSDPAPR